MEKNKLAESFGTLSETLNALVKIGYAYDFNVHQECLVCHNTNTVLQPEDFQIDKVYRFEGVSNPEDQSILYAISSPKFGIMGTLVNGYGISSDGQTAKLIENLQTNRACSAVVNGSNDVPLSSAVVNKSNDATPQRPEGSRVLNGELVEMNLDKFIDQVKNETTWAERDRNSITIFKSDTMRIVLMGLHENAELKSHKANGVLSVQVLEGKINFVVEQRTFLMEKGQMIALQANVTHSVVALVASFVLLTLSMNESRVSR